jgi:hypothetical protein
VAPSTPPPPSTKATRGSGELVGMSAFWHVGD